MSGAYLGHSGLWGVDVRLDAPLMSGDVFEGEMYRWSFLVTSLTENGRRFHDKAQYSGKAWIHSSGADQSVDVVLLVQQGGQGGSLSFIALASGHGPEKYEMAGDKLPLRQLIIDYDVQAASTVANLGRDVVTRLANQRMEVKLEEDRVEGIATVINTTNDALDGHESAWSYAELLEAMERHFDRHTTDDRVPGRPWRVWLAVVTWHEYGRIYGAMFDKAFRQGAAVFVSEMEDEPARQLFTCLHEIGHCFNLVHSAPDELTWMNYPERYDERLCPDDKRFLSLLDDVSFTESERTTIYHGPFSTNAPGAGPWRGDTVPGYVASSRLGGSGRTLRLELRPAKVVYLLGEPVIVEFKLFRADGGRNDITVSQYLRPEFGSIVVYIQTPSRRWREYKPLIHAYAGGPARRLTKERPAIYESVYLGFGAHGLHFDEVGDYRLRAVYRGPDGWPITSDDRVVHVANPGDRSERRLCDLLVREEVGIQCALLGTPYKRHAAGHAALDEVVEQFAWHPVSVYARLVRGFLRMRPCRDGNPTDVAVVRHDYDAAERDLSAVVRDHAGAGLDNITMNQVFQALAIVQYRTGRRRRAKRTISNMTDTFAKVITRESVLDDIDGLARQLERNKSSGVPKPVCLLGNDA